uniref:Uncharacterized protein n=1 Tax=Oryza barthii TaxID=65489 RepID=A0A0D3HLP4_9ORYZ
MEAPASGGYLLGGQPARCSGGHSIGCNGEGSEDTQPHRHLRPARFLSLVSTGESLKKLRMSD